MDVSAGHELRPMTGFSIMLTSCRGNHHIHIEDILKLPAAEISESTGFNSAGVVQFQRLCGRLDHWTNAAHVPPKHPSQFLLVIRSDAALVRQHVVPRFFGSRCDRDDGSGRSNGG